MKNRLGSRSVALLAICLAQGAGAAEFSVGRADVVLPNDEWQVFSLKEESIHYSGDVSGEIKLEKRVFVKSSASRELQAVAVVSSTPGGITRGYLSYSPSCPGNEQFFAKGNAGFNRPYAECWKVFQPFTSESVLDGLTPGVTGLLSQENISLPADLQALTSYYGNSNGTTLAVSLLVAPSVAGRQGEVKFEVPAQVNPAFVLLGQELADAVRTSVNSIRGKFVFPALEIKNASQ